MMDTRDTKSRRVNVRGWFGKSFLWLGVFLVAGCIPQDDPVNYPERVVLPNGITALLKPIPETKVVVVEAIYEVGFMDEPAGMTQVAHLMEHLVCYGATPGFKEKEAMRQLNAVGMANAETLPDWTHYDYVVPTNQLELALGIEAGRLAGPEFHQTLIEAEAKRCYQETDMVERNLQSGMLKHGFMALNQAWRHGRESAQVRGGLETMMPEALHAWRRNHYRPDNLTLILAGNFDPAQARTLLTNQLAMIQPGESSHVAPFRMDKFVGIESVSWDAKLSAVCLAYPVPETSRESAMLSLFGALLLTELHGDPALKELSHTVFCSNQIWPVGRMPFFFYAAAKDESLLSELETTLKTRSTQVVQDNLGNWSKVQKIARQMTWQMGRASSYTIEQQSKMLAEAQGITLEQAERLVVAQVALNTGTWNRLFGPDPVQIIQQIEEISAEQFRMLAEAYFAEDRMTVTRVVPGKQ